MTRAIALAALTLAVLALAPGAEASCHFCMEDLQEDCVDTPDVGPCSGTLLYIAEHPVDFVLHLVGDP